VLGSAGDVGGEALLRQLAREHLAHLGDVLGALRLGGLDLLLQVGVRARLEVAEAQVLQLALEAGDAQAVRQRRVDLHGLAGDAVLSVGAHVLERAHVVEAVAELDQEHADVARHRHQHLAEVLRLPVLLRGEVDLGELGHPVDEEGDLGPELALDVGRGRQRVLDDVVEQAGTDAGGVELEAGDHLRHARRVRKVRIAALARLPFVRPLAVGVGPGDQVDIRAWLVASNTIDDFVERKHSLARSNLRVLTLTPRSRCRKSRALSRLRPLLHPMG
jgi:hypothetical protein